MAENTLTNLIPSLYAGLDTVSRELTGFIPAVFRDTSAERAALNETITFPVSPAGTVGNITPAMAVPEPTGQTIGTNTMSITKSRAAEFGFVGEARIGLNNGPGYNVVQADMFAQAIRALVNEVENDLMVAACAAASRAVGAPDTALFATNLASLSALGKVLSDNGAPLTERQFVIDTTTGAALRTLYNLNDDRDFSKMPFGEQGILATPQGFQTRETGQAVYHDSGTAASATTSAAGFAKGATTITLAAAGTGSILAGDIITFAGDLRQYVVVTGDADVSGGGTVVIQSPGLMQAIPASATAIAIVATSNVEAYDVGGVAFYRNAIVLAARAPALPEGGDAAADRMVMVDPRSGLAFDVAVYKGYHKVRFDVGLAWGVKVTQSRHTALLVY